MRYAKIILIEKKTIKEKDIPNLNDDYLKNNIKNNKMKKFGAFYNNTLVGYISLYKQNENYEIKMIKIIENKNNVVYGLFNYAYAIARSNKIKKIIINQLNYDNIEKEFGLKEKYDVTKMEDGKTEINVKQLYKE